MLSEKYFETLFNTIEGHKENLITLSQTIWENPEIGHEEFMASDLLSTKLEENGFNVKRKIADMETSFIGSIKSEKPGPKVALIAEYDALPGKGHACGHNLYCCSAVGAGIALSKIINEIGGEIVVIGSPAEEGLVPNYGGKAILIKHGYFNDIDCAFSFHGENENVIERTLASSMAVKVRFKGKSAHAGGAPEKGINALTAGSLTITNVNAIRQQQIPTNVINAIMTNGGTVANTIPDTCHIAFSIRGKTISDVKKLLEDVRNCTEAAALVTGCTYEFEPPINPIEDTLSNHTLGLVMAEFLDYLKIPYKQWDSRNYAWDGGNVSYVCPFLGSYFKMGPSNIVCHTEEFLQAANSPEAHDSIITAAKAMATTACEFIISKELQEKVKYEFNNTIR